MPLFSYQAQTPEGGRREGTVDAPDMNSAEESLKEQGFEVIGLNPVMGSDLSFTIPSGDVRSPDEAAALPMTSAKSPAKEYLPLASTLRLYAGWLLAYYALVYALGWYASSRPLPWDIPFVKALLLSPLVLNFTFGVFLFLVFQSFHRAVGGGLWKGIALVIVGAGIFIVYRVNIV